MRGMLAVCVVVLVSCASGGVDYDAFRSAYVERYTGGDPFSDQPEALTDEQIDYAIERICPDGPDGEASLDAADDIGYSLAGGFGGSSSYGSSLYAAVRTTGACDLYPDHILESKGQ